MPFVGYGPNDDGYGTQSGNTPEDQEPLEPAVGMGATYYCGSDRYTYTVIEIRRNGRQLVLQKDTETLAEGNSQSERQVYTYTRDLNGTKVTVNQSHDGETYRERGMSHIKTLYYTIGQRRTYRDPSF
jgi:hypothetical protein